MSKLFVLFLFLISSGSMKDLLSDMDTEEVKKSDTLGNPCSSHLPKNISRIMKLPNEEPSSQHISNEENKDDKIPIVLDCLVKVYEKIPMDLVTETVKVANFSSRRSSDIKYLIETKDNCRDFITKRNRSKINEEPPIYINITKKCSKIEPKSQKKIMYSGRRFNNIPYFDNTHETNLNLFSKIDLNSTNNQSKIYMQADHELSTNKVSNASIIPPRYVNQTLSKKATNDPSALKYGSTLHDENIPKETFIYLDLDNKEITEKPSTKEFNPVSALHARKISKKQNFYSEEESDKSYKMMYDSSSTPSDSMNKNSRMFLDFSHKKIGDKPSLIKYDLKSVFENETPEDPLIKSPNLPNRDIYKSWLLDEDLGNKVADEKHSFEMHEPDLVAKENMITKEYHQDYTLRNKYADKPSTNYNEQITIPNNDTGKTLFMNLDPDNNGSDEDIKVFVDHREDLTRKKDNNNHSTGIYAQISKPYDDIYKLMYHDFGNKELSANNSSNINKAHYQDFTNKVEDDIHTYSKNDFFSTLPISNIYKDLFLYHDPSDKPAVGDKNTKIADQYQDLFHNDEDDATHTSNESEKAFTPNDDFFKDLTLFLSTSNKDLSNENIKILTGNYQDVNHKMDDDELFTRKSEKTFGHKSGTFNDLSLHHSLMKLIQHNGISKENHQDLRQQDLRHKDIGGLNAIKGLHSHETHSSKDELRTTIDVTEPHLVEPTTGYSIKDLFKARVMLLESTRVCYACSSISDHSCWQPNRRTTVKYCRKGHNACLTKTFKTEESEFIVIRDCGTTCDSAWPVLEARYKSCSICNDDMCNDRLVDINRGHINGFNLMYFVSLIVIVKYII